MAAVAPRQGSNSSPVSALVPCRLLLAILLTLSRRACRVSNLRRTVAQSEILTAIL